MRITARADYAVRALVQLAAMETGQRPVRAEDLSEAQEIPLRFLQAILRELRTAGLVRSARGTSGGYALARPATAITVADVMRALEGPLANVQDVRPDEVAYPGAAAGLRDVWVAVRSSLRDVLENVTVADVATGRLPDAVTARTADAEAWTPR